MANRRKRPHVPEENRKRVARACHTCRKLKEKCEGGHPCARCTRLERVCEFVDVPKTEGKQARSDDSWSIEDELSSKDRIQILEEIVRLCTGESNLSKNNLAQIRQSLRQRPNSAYDGHHSRTEISSESVASENNETNPYVHLVNPTTAVHADVFSHREFSARIQNELYESRNESNDKDLPAVLNNTDLSRASRLHTERSTVINAVAVFPPAEVANFLLDIFFKFAQTNYSYTDEQSLRNSLYRIYLDSTTIGSEDASWLCTLLMVFAIGSQFAHLSSKQVSENNVQTDSSSFGYFKSPDDEAALTFYHAAITLIPDAITLASVDSVQAFVLLGVYTLPIDAAGMSFTYLGIAIKIAVQNGMHRAYRNSLDPRTAELRNRIWWTVYTLEKSQLPPFMSENLLTSSRRVCVLHGRPVSISKSEVDTPLPSDLQTLRVQDRPDTLPNILAMIKLTSLLEDARDSISPLKNASRKSKALVIASISQVRRDLHDYWQSLPTSTNCRDLTPSEPLFRFNLHLALTYHLAHIYVGRNFIFTSSRADHGNSLGACSTLKWEELRTALVTSCMKSATEIIDLCQKLHTEVGLARASYTEFTSCRAALLTILAQRINERSSRLRKKTDQAMNLLRHMSLGFYAADAEKSQIEAIETAVRRLDDSSSDQNSKKSGKPGSTSLAYDQFRNWASLWKARESQVSESINSQFNPATTQSILNIDSSAFSGLSPLQNLGWDMYLPSPFDPSDDFAFDMSNLQP